MLITLLILQRAKALNKLYKEMKRAERMGGQGPEEEKQVNSDHEDEMEMDE